MRYPQSNDKNRSKPHQRGAIAFASIALCCSGAGAAEADRQVFSIGGFGSLGVVHSSESHADFPGGRTQPDGAGYSRNWSAQNDSRIGAQMDARITSELSVVLQVIAEQQWNNTYTPKVEWANVRYAFTPDFSVRIGRSVLPSMLLSDSRKVGYTIPWVRPPAEVYQQVPVTNNDGLDLTYRFHIGKASNSVTAYAGKSQLKFTGQFLPGNLLKVNNIAGAVDALKYGNLLFQAAYMRTTLAVPFFATIPVPAVSSQAGNMAFHMKQLSATYDPGKWFVLGEWVKTPIDVFGNRSGWYVSAGLRVNNVTPYVIYAKQKQDTPATAPVQPIGGQQTASIGMRWDVKDNVDVKLQYDRINLDPNSAGVLRPRPGFQPGGNAGIFSAIVDFAF